MDKSTAGRKDSCFQGVPIFRGSLRGIQFLWGRISIPAGFLTGTVGEGDTNKGVVTDYMGVRVPLGTFTKGTHFIRERSLLYGREIPWRSFKFPGHLHFLEGTNWGS